MKRTGGNWDPSEGPVYFIASDAGSLAEGAKSHHHVLVAVNEINSEFDTATIGRFMAEGKSVFIDSGVFWLTNEHARAHDMTMDDVLGLAPTDLDGFDDLFARYVDLIKSIGDRVWGYIEIDQGGRENKIRTRARLEGMGLRPIPVYHPFNDGWDYFDELAANYDRICFGNVVQADGPTRKKLIATAWERRRRYPHLWIHILGLTPSEIYTAMPNSSCDSSAWLSQVRWADAMRAKIWNKGVWSLGGAMTYRKGSDADGPDGHKKARRLGGYDAHMSMRTIRAVNAEWLGALGLDVFGAPS